MDKAEIERVKKAFIREYFCTRPQPNDWADRVAIACIKAMDRPPKRGRWFRDFLQALSG